MIRLALEDRYVECSFAREQPIVGSSSTAPLSASGLWRRSPDRHRRDADYSMAPVERLFMMLIGFERVSGLAATINFQSRPGTESFFGSLICLQ
jgi:hypothetical protein